MRKYKPRQKRCHLEVVFSILLPKTEGLQGGRSSKGETAVTASEHISITNNENFILSPSSIKTDKR